MTLDDVGPGVTTQRYHNNGRLIMLEVSCIKFSLNIQNSLGIIMCKFHAYILSLCQVCGLRLVKILFCSVLLGNPINSFIFQGGSVPLPPPPLSGSAHDLYERSCESSCQKYGLSNICMRIPRKIGKLILH